MKTRKNTIKTRKNITIDKDLVNELSKEAKLESRPWSNYIELLLINRKKRYKFILIDLDKEKIVDESDDLESLKFYENKYKKKFKNLKIINNIK